MNAIFRALLLSAVMGCACVTMAQSAGTNAATSAYTADGRLQFPQQYRQWIYLTSGFDMSYSAGAAGAHHLFDNLFVNPAAYRAFQSTGTWPEGTVLVLELRRASAHDSLNRQGAHQAADVVGVEVHSKDSARFKGSWGFFSFGGADAHGAAKMLPLSADCYACHAAHGAVDSTFVQFYPTLLPIARSKGTLSASYR